MSRLVVSLGTTRSVVAWGRKRVGGGRILHRHFNFLLEITHPHGVRDAIAFPSRHFHTMKAGCVRRAWFRRFRMHHF